MRALLWTSFATFLLGGLECCFGQTDNHLLATGDWSEIVHDHDAHSIWGLRGRLVVYDDQGPSASNHARVYLELQHVFEGGWSNPVEIYFGADGSPPGSRDFELKDEHDNPIPQDPPVFIDGPVLPPFDVVLPVDSTIRLRADVYHMGPEKKPDGLNIFVGGNWTIPPNAKNKFFLSADFHFGGRPGSCPYHVWLGTLHLPAVKIPVPRQ